MICYQPEWLATYEVVSEHLGRPHCCQHFPFVAAVIGLVFVKGPADAGAHVLIPLWIQLAQNRAKSSVREVRVQDERFLVVDSSQHYPLAVKYVL